MGDKGKERGIHSFIHSSAIYWVPVLDSSLGIKNTSPDPVEFYSGGIKADGEQVKK